MRASVNYVGSSSLIVGIRVIAENFKEKTIKHTNSSYFTFVSIDDNGKPKKVTGLELTTDQEIRRFALGKLRKEQKIADSKEFEELKANMDLNSIHLSWINENCIVSTDR